MVVREYIMNISDKTFRIYDENEKSARKKFALLCTEYANTDNEQYRDYWLNLWELTLAGEYMMYENPDFKGVRMVV